MAMSTPKGACKRSQKPSKKVACDSKYFCWFVVRNLSLIYTVDSVLISLS